MPSKTSSALISPNLLFLALLPTSSYAETLTLDEVIVTAERREESLANTAASIDVISSETVIEQQLNQLSDLNNISANFSITPSTIFKNINIRGIGGGGRNAGFDTRAGVYVDGVYVGQGVALDNPVFDIEQIEILKGPQGFLFGNNSNAGAINITTKQPTHQRERSLTSGVGNYGYWQNMLKLNGEITDRLTGRLVIRNEDRNGFVNNSFDGKDLKYLWRFGTRAQIKLEATDNLDVTFSADYINHHQDIYVPQAVTGFFGQPLPPDNAASFSRVNYNHEPYSRVEGHGYSVNADYYLPNDGQFKAILAKRDWQSETTNDSDYSTLDLLNVSFDDKSKQTSQEFRYTSPLDIDWPFVVGVYFSQSEDVNDRVVDIGPDANTPVSVPFAPVQLPFSVAFGLQPGASLPVWGKVNTDTKAIYANIDHRFGSNFVLHLGGRYSREEKKLNFSIDGSQSGALGFANLSNERQKIEQSFFSPMIGLSYHLNNQSHLYGKVSRAYKSGGWNVDYLNAAQVNDGFEYDPETVVAYELGYKLNQPKTQFSAALFANHYQDYQVFQFANLGGNTQVLQLRNAATVKSYGVELELRHLINARWNIDANIAYLDAFFDKFPNGGAGGSDASGQNLPDAPRHSGSINVNYLAPLFFSSEPLKFTVQSNFQSSTYSAISNDPSTAEIKTRNILNAFASYTAPSKRWSISLWLKNLTNKKYALAKGTDVFGNQVWINALPRTYGVNGTINF